MKIISRICFLISVLSISFAQAQSPVSGFFQGKGKGSVSFSFTSEKYSEVFLVPTTAEEVPLFRDVTTTSYNIYGTYGISDKVELVASLPYIQSKGNANESVLNDLNFSNTRNGLQDVSFLAKFKPVSLELGENKLDLIGVVGISTPLGGYEVDEGLQSIIAIGNRATKINTIGVAHFSTAFGLFATGQAGFSLRSNDVPNAFISELKLGYAQSKFYVDAWLAHQISDKSGVDILQPGFEGFFPATRVDYTRIGATAFVPFYEGLGVFAGVSSYIAGRNLGKSTGFSLGLNYNF